jgi:uncharacterized protein YndB with AHSA1/START domain
MADKLSPPGYGDLIRVEESVEIAASPDEVWAVVADPDNDPRWCRKVESVQPTADGRWTVSHKPVPLRPPIELVVEHLVVDPPRRLVLREEDEVSIFNVEYRIESGEAGTRFTQISVFEWKKLPRVLHGTFARGVRRDVRGQLQALKQLVER